MPQIPDQTIDQIRMAVNIVDVVGRYVALKKRGRNYVGLCPFHQEKTPSFSVNPEKQIFHCFGCGAGGNVFRFLMDHEKLGFVEAVRQLAGETGIAIPEAPVNPQRASEREQLGKANAAAADFFKKALSFASPKVREYLQNRGLTDETIARFAVGFAPEGWDGLLNFIQQNKLPQKHFETLGLLLFSPKSGKPYDRFRNRIMFPIHDPGGQIIAFGGRTLDKDPQTPKYINSPESPVYYKSQVLYGLFQARQGIRESGKALFVEGYMDVIQLHQHGVGNAVATSGTALTEDHARLIRRYTEKVVLCYDADRAGISAAARGGEILFQNNLDVEVLILPQGEDPDSYVQKNGREAFVKLLGEAEDYLTFRIAQTRQEYDLSRASERSQAVNGLLDMLAPISDVIKANFYVERLSADLQLPATMLLSELQKKQKALQQRRRYQASVPVQTAEQPETPVRKPQKGDINVFTGAWGGEKDIILLLIRYYDNIQAYVYGHVENEDFQNPEFRQIFELLSGQEGVEGDALLHLVLNETESPELRNLLLREVEHANREFKKPAVYLQGCIRNLKMARYQAIIETGKHRLRNIKADDPNMLSVMREMRQAQIEYKKWKDVEPVDTDE